MEATASAVSTVNLDIGTHTTPVNFVESSSQTSMANVDIRKDRASTDNSEAPRGFSARASTSNFHFSNVYGDSLSSETFSRAFNGLSKLSSSEVRLREKDIVKFCRRAAARDMIIYECRECYYVTERKSNYIRHRRTRHKDGKSNIEIMNEAEIVRRPRNVTMLRPEVNEYSEGEIINIDDDLRRPINMSPGLSNSNFESMQRDIYSESEGRKRSLEFSDEGGNVRSVREDERGGERTASIDGLKAMVVSDTFEVVSGRHGETKDIRDDKTESYETIYIKDDNTESYETKDIRDDNTESNETKVIKSKYSVKVHYN